MIKLNGTPKQYANLGEIMAWASMQDAEAIEPVKKQWRTWVTAGMLSFKLDGISYVIPDGFMTDFSSVPRMLRWLFTPTGEPHQVAGLVHDVLYSSTYVTRKAADVAFRDVARLMGQSKLPSQLMYWALRLGGSFAFRSNRAAMDEGGPRWRFLQQ